ncbi:hypothetical protein ACFSHT_40040 [Paraburkholderia silviterrae]|uniref:Low-density lipoprotein receptor repeat class B n=1 Tax=Paraburkholderia silviterrae TaxID=2528715 RepID=A0A4R5M379_9BURK|nr:hypothetical protein [Paraburkholderia silviterrae]TDG19386.1 hypothetical protein EYW47_30835 [Paraburkholderia silviterrae]
MKADSTSARAILALRIDHPSIVSIDADSGDAHIVLDDLGGTPDGIQVDLAQNLVYWTNMGKDFHLDDGTVEVARLDGTGRRVLVGNGAIRTPKQIYLDRHEKRLYWCDREGAAIWRSDADGKNLTKLVDRSSAPGGKDDVLNACVGIAVDHRRHAFIWTQKGPAKGGKGRIFRAPLAMLSGETAASRTDIELLLGDLPEPIDLEIDAAKDLLYWTDRGAEPDGNSLNCAAITETGLEGHRVICTGFAEAIGLALDPARNLAYVSDLGGNLVAVDVVTGSKKRVGGQCGKLTGIALCEAPLVRLRERARS